MSLRIENSMSLVSNHFSFEKHSAMLPPSLTSFGSPENTAKRSIPEFALMFLLGWLPDPIGSKVRGLIYPKLFKSWGKNVTSKPNLDITNAAVISVGEKSTLMPYAVLQATSTDSSITLEKGAMLDRGAFVTTVYGFKECHIHLAENAYIGPFSFVVGPGNISIGKNSMIGSHVGIYANNHNFSDLSTPIRDQGLTRQGIIIGEDCWLGAGVKVVDGVTIGNGCVIGAGAVVTKDIPDYSVAVGVPAHVVSKRK